MKKGIIRFLPITMEYLANRKDVMAIAGKEIVSVSVDDTIPPSVLVSHNGGKPYNAILDTVNVSDVPFLRYPVMQEYEPVLSIPGYEIEGKLWRFIVNNSLENVRVQFQQSENVVTSLTLYRPPIIPVLVPVFKVKTILQGDNCNINHFESEEYETKKQAEEALPEIAKRTYSNADNGIQAYFQIEMVLKRKEQEEMESYCG